MKTTEKEVFLSSAPSNIEQERLLEMLRKRAIDTNDFNHRQEFLQGCGKWFMTRFSWAVEEKNHHREEYPLSCLMDLLDKLYRKGYEDRQKDRDYDPRGCDEWGQLAEILLK